MERSTRKKQKMNKWPIIIISILVLLVVGFFGARAYQASQVKKQGQETVEAFVKELKKGNYKELTNNLSAD